MMMKKKNSAVIGSFSGKCCDSTVFNNNDMFLSGELFDKLFESDDYKRALALGHYIGYLGHPEDPGCMDYEHACIVMRECHKNEDGSIEGTFDLVDTPVGRVVKAFLDAGVQFGISIRGAGDVDGEGNVDPETFVFRGFDLVTFPAYDDAIPEFQEIAASSDIDKKVKYKKVCAEVNKNLSNITSASTLHMMKDQFNEHSDEYKVIEDRINEIEGCQEKEDELNLLKAKVAGMTDLYFQEVACSNSLRNQLAKSRSDCLRIEAKGKARIRAMKRITCSQQEDLETQLDSLELKYSRAIQSNTQLKKDIDHLEKTNLKYRQKIEANSQTICERDSAISDLRAKLSKTVTASSKIETRASNLDEEVKSLRARVEAAEQMVLNYQQAYANMYANALGVHLEGINVTASTSVEELQIKISSGTNTANIAVAPFVEPEPFIEDSDEDESNEFVTL